MSNYKEAKLQLKSNPKVWLITGVAGFIGSNLLEHLLKLDQIIIGLDNFSTGHKYNLDEVQASVTETQWQKFQLIKGDIRDYETCVSAIKGVDYVLHQAALGSVPRSIADPISSNETNVSGFLNVLQAAKDEDVKSFTYAASSSTYGDHPALPKVEANIGNPLSPYAVTKLVNELYAGVYARNYGFKTIGLRYFNVFGKRQDPNSTYAAVIPKWTAAMIQGDDVLINGDGETSRDFCFVENTVQMNILAATASDEAKDQVYNVAVGERTNLNDLFGLIKASLESSGVQVRADPVYRDFRAGDVMHSQADISKAVSLLGYVPEWQIGAGITQAMSWYCEKFSKNTKYFPEAE